MAWGGEPTIAHELLMLEGEKAEGSVAMAKLDALMAAAVQTFGTRASEQTERATALSFFQAVDQALIRGNVIFPPEGSVDFFREGLKGRVLSDTEFRQALNILGNRRREPWMQASRSIQEEVYFFDCDLASVFYVAVAERLDLPVFLVESPGHNFVRWESTDLHLNWDPNDGMLYPDDFYVRTKAVTAFNREIFGYLENRDRTYIVSYWHVMLGRQKQRDGDAAGAVGEFREAIRWVPSDRVALYELAWLLATSSDATVRNGLEAAAISEGLVEKARRAVWLQTLAAACAEAGDGSRAITLMEEAERVLDTELGWLSRFETLIDSQACLSTYRSGRTYAEARQAGILLEESSEGK